MTRILPGGKIVFGKHAGRSLSSPEVPLHYLQWMIDTLDLSCVEQDRVHAEIAYRLYPDEEDPPTKTVETLPVGVTLEAMQDIINAGRQALAKRLHPDVGGDLEKMKAINSSCDFLKQQLMLWEAS